MQPFYSYLCRNLRHHLALLVLVGATALVAVASADSARAEANAPGTYSRMPVMFKDWTTLGTLPDGPDRMDREQLRQGEYFRRWKIVHEMVGEQHTSRLAQELLAKRGYGPALFDSDADKSGRAFDGIDTLKVLIVRVSFETNRDSNLTSVDPSGDFVLEPPENLDDLLVDPPPRNRDFYQSHLVGLSEYYKYQSGGRLHIEGTVLPEEQDASYKLSDIADYGPGAGGFWSLESLERVVRDMIDTGDDGTSGSEFDFSNYDDSHPFTYIIFVHAGSDWQSDINGDSPNDIPTFFVTLGEPHDLNSGGQLSECSVIPETTNQDGYPGSIAAAFYHEFGHALGLVDVYNTTTGYPSVGIWDLMDSGTNLPVTLGHITADNDTIIKAATGVLPPSLSVWNKWFLGWVEMDEVDGRSEDYKLPAVEVPRDQYAMWDDGYGDFDLSYPQAIRAGASPREYFLLENRYVPPAPDASGTYTPYDALYFEKDDATGVIQYLAGRRFGQWSNSGMYDYFMPDGGLLVWHVNMDRISENLFDNTINAYGDGLKLVEADGIQDIGVLDAYVLGWYGSVRDPFNENNGYANLYSDGYPSSRNFDRSWSGVSLTDIRNNDHRSASVMRFGASVEPLAAGFPWNLSSVTEAEGENGARGLDTSTLTPVNLGGNSLLLFADQPSAQWTDGHFPASLFALRSNGTSPWLPPADHPAGAFLGLDAPLAGPPVVLDPEASNKTVVYGTRAGTMGTVILSGSADPAAGESVSVGDSLIYGPVMGLTSDESTLVMAPISRDSLVFWDPMTGDVVETKALTMQINSQPRVYNDPADEAGDRLALTTDEYLSLSDFHSASAVLWPWSRTPVGQLHTAIVANSDQTLVLAFDDEGYLPLASPPAGYPHEFNNLDQPLVCEPAVADLDGNGTNDLILATADRVFAFNADGIALTGYPSLMYDLFPLPAETSITGPLIVADATGDGVNDIFYTTDGGHLMGLDHRGRLLPELPLRWGDNGVGGLAMAADDAGNNLLWMTSPGGYATEPFGRNHVNARVMATVWGATASAEDLTSSWLGPLGGSSRQGTVGTARNLGSSAPASKEIGKVIMYPNPVHGRDVTVRFYAHAQSEAQLYLYNLQGEQVTEAVFDTTADSINEHRLDVSGLASGLYLGRLVYPGSQGTETRTMTLAVER